MTDTVEELVERLSAHVTYHRREAAGQGYSPLSTARHHAGNANLVAEAVATIRKLSAALSACRSEHETDIRLRQEAEGRAMLEASPSVEGVREEMRETIAKFGHIAAAGVGRTTVAEWNASVDQAADAILKLFQGSAQSLPRVAPSGHTDAEPAAALGCGYPERFTFHGDDDGGIDEVVLHGVDVHLERMDGRSYFLTLNRPDGSSLALWIGGKKGATYEARDGFEPARPADVNVLAPPTPPQQPDLAQQSTRIGQTEGGGA